MAIFVYPWWATLLNSAVAAYLLAYLVRLSPPVCTHAHIHAPSDGRGKGWLSSFLLQHASHRHNYTHIHHQATHLRRVVICHVGRLRMLFGIGSLYQFPLWYQGIKDAMAGT